MSLGSKIKIILGRFSGATILFLLDKALEMRGVYTDNPNLSNILVALSFGWLVFALLTWPQKRLAIGNNNRHPIILDQDFRPICGFSESFTQGFSQSFTHPRVCVAFF